MDQELSDAGIRDPTTVEEVWSFNPNIGGPIIKDKLWFFAAHTSQRAFIYPTGSYWATDPAALWFVPNYSDRVLDTSTAREQGGHLTWQAIIQGQDQVPVQQQRNRPGRLSAGPNHRVNLHRA